MNNKVIKVHWQNEELDIYYKKMGYPKSIWQDNEGKPFGIYSYIDEDCVDCSWYATENERDNALHKELKQWWITN